MLGKLLTGIIKVATLPIDVVESAADVFVGGDGSKESKEDNPLNIGSKIRDGVCRGIEDNLEDDQ